MSQSLVFVTGNKHKFAIAERILKGYKIPIEQVFMDIDEIQGEDAEVIARDKAQKAFDAVGKPIFVCDSTWLFMGLGGFPGPYMKSIVHWFETQHFLDLTRSLKDRSVIFREFIVYQDQMEQVAITIDMHGTLLTEARGTAGVSIDKVVSLSKDGESISEKMDHGLDSMRGDGKNVWQAFGEWYAEHKL